MLQNNQHQQRDNRPSNLSGDQQIDHSSNQASIKFNKMPAHMSKKQLNGEYLRKIAHNKVFSSSFLSKNHSENFFADLGRKIAQKFFFLQFSLRKLLRRIFLFVFAPEIALKKIFFLAFAQKISQKNFFAELSRKIP